MQFQRPVVEFLEVPARPCLANANIPTTCHALQAQSVTIFRRSSSDISRRRLNRSEQRMNQLDDWPVFGIFAGGLTMLPKWIQCRSLPALSVLLQLHYIARSE